MSEHRRGSYLGTSQAKQYQFRLEQARQEIERLRAAANKEITALYDACAAKDAGIKRLREALQATLDAPPWGDQGDPEWAAQARRALEGK